MCVPNTPERLIFGKTRLECSQAIELAQMKWESEIREAELDRLIKLEKIQTSTLNFIQRILSRDIKPEIKIAILKTELQFSIYGI